MDLEEAKEICKASTGYAVEPMEWLIAEVDRLQEEPSPLFYQLRDEISQITKDRDHERFHREAAEAEIERLQSSLTLSRAEVEKLQEALRDYREMHQSHKANIRKMDVAMNGEEGAAQQASLCDLVSQMPSILTLSREEGRREGMMRAAEIAERINAEAGIDFADVPTIAAAIRSEAKGERKQE